MMTLLSRGRSIHPHNWAGLRGGCRFEFPNIGAPRLEQAYECGTRTGNKGPVMSQRRHTKTRSRRVAG
jgi:hypothetical protein